MSQTQQPQSSVPSRIETLLAVGISMDDMQTVADELSKYWSNKGVTVTVDEKEQTEIAVFKTASGGMFTIKSSDGGYACRAETPDGQVSLRGVDTLNQATTQCCEFISSVNY